MKSLLKRLRGAVGTALTWAGAWAIGGLGLTVFIYVVGPGLDGRPFWEVAPLLTFRSGVWGFVSGMLFSGALVAFQRRRTLADLKPWQMALWGAAAGLLIPSVLVGIAIASGALPLREDVVGSLIFIFGGLGVLTAAGTIRLAQGPSAPWVPRHVGPGDCPKCGFAVPEDALTCPNYPRGRVRSQCGHDLTSWRLLNDGGLASALPSGIRGSDPQVVGLDVQTQQDS